MKGIRSKTPLTFGDLNKRSGIVAVIISRWIWEEEIGRYVAEVKDFEVKDVESPGPGQPLKQYIFIGNRTRTRTPAEVNTLFQYFGVDVIVGDNYNEKAGRFRLKGSFTIPSKNLFTDPRPKTGKPSTAQPKTPRYK